ncbi:HEAT repeat domain-containing protein [Actinomadura vinacea]|uniref:HEAT repeat domain-containing protein n=1 Tax=Actinomadura vinacea TaxID=115336 RepID=UPI0031E0FA44
MSARSVLSALAGLADGSAIGVIIETLATALPHELWSTACSALEAFGPSARPALQTIRCLITASDAHVRPAAVAALWAIVGDPDEVMQPLLDLLDDSVPFRINQAADVLADIGPPAQEALPHLRDLLTHSYEWVRVPCATALWEIGGDAEAPAVLDTLLQAWGQNPSTANHVVACLDRMGPAARPALPQLRSELHHTQIQQHRQRRKAARDQPHAHRTTDRKLTSQPSARGRPELATSRDTPAPSEGAELIKW